jgi:hypothetical protein
MSSNGDMSRSPALPTWSQIVALAMTYRRLLEAWAIAPVLTVSAPLVSKMAYFVLDRFTNNHTILSLLMVCALTMDVRKMIRQSASSKESAKEAVAKTEVGLPCLLLDLALISACSSCFLSTVLWRHNRIRSYGRRHGFCNDQCTDII